MVVATMARRRGASGFHHFFHDKALPATTLGILSFDAGKTMCRLVSLYKSLSDEEILKLRQEVIKSKGVAYLNSQQECFLLNLACSERGEELNLAAATVSRLGRKCSDIGLSRFDLVYADLKLGFIDIRKLEYGTRNIQKIIDKMEKLVSATGNLHAAMESLAEMEASERKTQRWTAMGNLCSKANMEYFNEKIAFQTKQVQHYKDVSLWNKTFDKAVGLMARIVCIVYARICSVFGAYIADCDNICSDCSCLLEHRDLYRTNRRLSDHYEESLHKRVAKSAPIPKTTKMGVFRFLGKPLPFDIVAGYGGAESCGDEPQDDGEVAKNNRVLRLAPPSTVGGAGLSLRYANVILFAERCLHTPATVGEDAREELYDMLPEGLKVKVRMKLRRHWMKGEEKVEDVDDGHLLAEGWRDALEELMEWLSPVAHDTVRWQAERHLEKQRFDTKTTALLLQTLHYSDLEKAEAAIVEVLVGLSCIYWYENRRSHCQVRWKR